MYEIRTYFIPTELYYTVKIDQHCAACNKQNASNKCGKCKSIFYCNEKCQKTHWKKHKKICKKLRGNKGKKATTSPQYIQRINHVLKINESMENENDQGINEPKTHQDIYDKLNKYYEDKGGMNQFVLDYHHFVSNIDNETSSASSKCDISSCNHVKRNYRDQSIFDHDNKKRFELYEHSTSEQSVVIQQMLDIIHVSKYHLTDLGFRAQRNLHDKNDRNNTDNYEWIKNSIIPKMDLSRSSGSKFITKVMDDDDNENDQARYPKYSSGIRFFYHPYYKNNQARNERIPGYSSMVEYGNSMIDPSYTFGYWYVAPKYHSMKDEVTQFAENKLSIIQYKNTMRSALLKFSSMSKHIRGASEQWEIACEIPRNSPITLQHIIAITLYTDFTNLSSEFTTSFRKLSSSESDESLKSRHRAFGHWARLLRESVEVWGTPFCDALQHKVFYHGINKQMVFPGFKQKFCSPTSCTLSLEVAAGFANSSGYDNGIVISIKNNNFAISFFDCKPWSRFPWELEVLFVGGFQAMEINGLITINDGKSYSKYIEAIQRFQIVMIQNERISEKITKENVQIIDQLFDIVLQSENDTKVDHAIPEYVLALFRNILNATEYLCIDVGRVDKVLLFKSHGHSFYGGLLFKHLYFTDNNDLKWNSINKLYPSLKQIIFRKIEIVPNRLNDFVFKKSIMINDKFMEECLLFIENRKDTGFTGIAIDKPINRDNELERIENKYLPRLEELNWGMRINKEYRHPAFGSCTRVNMGECKPKEPLFSFTFELPK